MENLIKDIKASFEAILADIDKTDNKAARARVRKESLKLAKTFKEYRAVSLM